jgi:crotonobetainyl-CoA:carnitine CoA-transferase CaiB-like acyl-CoA transferase
MTGLVAAFALLAGITSARVTGRGRDVDTSLFDLALFNLNYPGTWYLNAGAVTGREKRSGHPSLVPSQLFRTRDGWIFIMCNKEKFWGLLAKAVGHPEWESDPELATFAARLRNRAQVTRLLDEALAARTTAEWLERFAGEIPAAPVLDVKAALDNPAAQAGGRILHMPHPVRGAMSQLANPVRLTGEQHPARPAPALGADTEEILRGLGYSTEKIAALRKAGAV